MLGSPVLHEKSLLLEQTLVMGPHLTGSPPPCPQAGSPVPMSGIGDAIGSSSLCIQTLHPTLPGGGSPTQANKQVWMELLGMRSRCQAAFLPPGLQKSSFRSACHGAERWGPGETSHRSTLASVKPYWKCLLQKSGFFWSTGLKC